MSSCFNAVKCNLLSWNKRICEYLEALQYIYFDITEIKIYVLFFSFSKYKTTVFLECFLCSLIAQLVPVRLRLVTVNVDDVPGLFFKWFYFSSFSDYYGCHIMLLKTILWLWEEDSYM